MKRFLSIATLMLAGSGSCVFADDSCKAVVDATTKVNVTPAHVYSTYTSEARKNKTITGELIYSGGPSGAIYVMVDGKWRKSPMTPSEMTKQQEENRRKSKMSCHYLRDESVNGEGAAVYSAHSESEAAKTDMTVWVSKSKGLPLRADIDVDAGGTTAKSHESIRYEYTNVHPPAGAQ